MIGINEAIVRCIEKLLDDKKYDFHFLMKSLETSKAEMQEYITCKKSMPLAYLARVSRFFNMSLEEFFIKARINKNPKENNFDAEKIIYFRQNFLSQWSEDKLVGEFEN
jgi:hypothetical protein